MHADRVRGLLVAVVVIGGGWCVCLPACVYARFLSCADRFQYVAKAAQEAEPAAEADAAADDDATADGGHDHAAPAAAPAAGNHAVTITITIGDDGKTSVSTRIAAAGQ